MPLDVDPQNIVEYQTRIKENSKIGGVGLETYVDMPCPFCGLPGFVRYRIMDVTKILSTPTTCKHCGRGAVAVVKENSGSMTFEMVQTLGPDPQPFVPTLRRV